MTYKFGKTVVVALGGSIIFPEKIDAQFIKFFKKFLEKHLRRGRRFVIIVGGGRLARMFQEAANAVVPVTDEDKDWIGIHSTRLNAHLLRTIFKDVADPVVFDARHKMKKLKYPITVASGWRPGWSTDYVAVALAADFGIPEVVVAGRPAYVYDKDHALHRDAKPIKEISWPRYRKMIPRKWVPGAHAPVDPVAAALAEKRKIKALIVNGKDLKNFDNLLRGRNFCGSVIESR